MILSWKAPIDYSERLIGSYDTDKGAYQTRGSNFDYLSLLAGRPYPDGMDKPSVFFRCPASKLSDHDCFWLLGGVPLVSARLAQFLAERASGALERLIPAAIHASDREIKDGFFVLNAVDIVDAVDLDRSEAKRTKEGSVLYFNKLFFRDDALGEKDIAREQQSGELILSARLADQLIEGGFTGHKCLGFYRENGSLVPYRDQA